MVPGERVFKQIDWRQDRNISRNCVNYDGIYLVNLKEVEILQYFLLIRTVDFLFTFKTTYYIGLQFFRLPVSVEGVLRILLLSVSTKAAED